MSIMQDVRSQEPRLLTDDYEHMSATHSGAGEVTQAVAAILRFWTGSASKRLERAIGFLGCMRHLWLAGVGGDHGEPMIGYPNKTTFSQGEEREEGKCGERVLP